MSISAKIRYLIDVSGMKQSDFVEPLHMSSKQSLSNKFVNERWSIEDGITIANLTGCKLAFIRPNGEQIILENEKSPDR